jgi:hypothetical protein
VIKAANEFRDKTTVPNQLRQTDFTYLKVIGWGWFYLSTILDDSRYIIAWKMCTTMKAEDVTDTLNLALIASGCDQAMVHQRPRLLSDNGPVPHRRRAGGMTSASRHGSHSGEAARALRHHPLYYHLFVDPSTYGRTKSCDLLWALAQFRSSTGRHRWFRAKS